MAEPVSEWSPQGIRSPMRCVRRSSRAGSPAASVWSRKRSPSDTGCRGFRCGRRSPGCSPRVSSRSSVTAGPTVSETLVQDSRELLQIRRGLEILAAQLAAAKRGGAVADELAAIAEDDQHDEHGADGPSFHELVAAASGNRQLEEMLAGVNRRVQWGLGHNPDASTSDHRVLAIAIVNGSVMQAGYLMDEHLSATSGTSPTSSTTRSRTAICQIVLRSDGSFHVCNVICLVGNGCVTDFVYKLLSAISVRDDSRSAHRRNRAGVDSPTRSPTCPSPHQDRIRSPRTQYGRPRKHADAPRHRA